MLRHFKKQVADSEIEVTIYVNPFIPNGQLLENNSVRHVDQNVTDSSEVPEKVSVE